MDTEMKPNENKIIVFNPLDPKFRVNPYPIYEHLQTHDPIHRTRSFAREWLLTRYADIKTLLSNPHIGIDNLPRRLQDKVSYLPLGENLNDLVASIQGWLFFLNPPEHTRLKGLVTQVFSLGEVENLRPRIQKLVDDLITRVYATGQIDILSDLAAPLPTLVSAEILGVPPTEREELTQWSYELFRVFDQPMSLQGYQKMNQAALKFNDYFRYLITEKEKRPQEDLMSKLITIRDQDKTISQEELVSFCAMLFSVGQETTENLIGNGMLALLQHPDQMSRLKANSKLIKNTVEELLRFDTPVQIIARLAHKNIEISGTTIQEGDRVYCALGAANRDPRIFPNPHQLDITRQGVHSIPFGYGIHFCLGAALARLQGQVAIDTVVQRLPDLKITSDALQWRENIVLRGLKTLPASFTVNSDSLSYS